jgi:hypothetical protein
MKPGEIFGGKMVGGTAEKNGFGRFIPVNRHDPHSARFSDRFSVGL